MIKEILPDDPEWDHWISRTCHDFYFSRSYHAYEAQRTGGKAVLFVHESGERCLLWPAIQRPVDDLGAYSDLTSVYGYAGPLIVGDPADEEFLSKAWEQLVFHWRHAGIVSVFTRFHPIFRNHRFSLNFLLPADEGSGARGVAYVGDTVSIDLESSEQEQWYSYSKQLRQEICYAQRQGVNTFVDKEWKSTGRFIEMYNGTMAGNKSHQPHFLNEQDLRDFREALHPSIKLLTCVREDAEIGGMLIGERSGYVHALFAGIEYQDEKLSPLKCLIDFARVWASKRQNKLLHLGGGRGGQSDMLLTFKKRFSRRRHEFYVGRWIINSGVYNQAVVRRSGLHHSSAIGGGFFPAYRAPS